MPPHFPPRPKKERIRTSIWHEVPSAENPFLAEKTFCHGYAFEELIDRFNWAQLLFLHLTGELPTEEEGKFLNLIMAAVMNPGPRDASVRAAMNCGIGKTPVATILTTGLTVRGGMAEGGLCVEAAMRFLFGELPKKDYPANGVEKASAMIDAYEEMKLDDSCIEITPWPDNPPGFGLYYGSKDSRSTMLTEKLDDLGYKGGYLEFARTVEMILSGDRNVCSTLPGIFAAVCCDFGLSPEHGSGLYLIAGSAGILAHGAEQLSRQWNEYPFWSDPKYYSYESDDPISGSVRE